MGFVLEVRDCSYMHEHLMVMQHLKMHRWVSELKKIIVLGKFPKGPISDSSLILCAAAIKYMHEPLFT